MGSEMRESVIRLITEIPYLYREAIQKYRLLVKPSVAQCK